MTTAGTTARHCAAAEPARTVEPDPEAIIRPIIIATLALVTAGPPLPAQSIAAGAISGVVRDEAGQPLSQVRVLLHDPESGFERVAQTGRSGGFDFLLLPPGTYDVFAERLWYRPVRVEGVAVRPGRQSTVQIRLDAMAPPIEEPGMERFREGGYGLSSPGQSRPGTAWWLESLELDRLPDVARGLAQAARYPSISTAQLATEGLPGHMTGVAADGIIFQSAAHADPSVSSTRTLPIPLMSVAQADLRTNGLDVEWSGYPGATLSAATLRGSRRFQVRGYADWWGEALSGSRHLDVGPVPANTFRGGVQVSAPVIPDSAEFVLGVEVGRLQVPRPPAWVSTPIDSALLAVASDSFGVDLTSYTTPGRLETKIGSVFTRLDWRVMDGHAVSVRGSAARFQVENPDFGLGHLTGHGADLDGNDISGGATLSNRLSRRLASEFRFGLEWSVRDHGRSELPASALVDGPAVFGSDPGLPGRFERLGVRVSETVHLLLGRHRIKLGGFFNSVSSDHTYDAWRAGAFAFGGVEELARGEGLFVQSVGPLPVAKFNTINTGGYLQYNLRAVSGLDLTAGLRLDAEMLPSDKAPLNDDWQERTGLDNTALEKSRVKISPRLGFTWDVGNWHRWLVEGEAGVYRGLVEPGLLAEWIVRSGSADVRRALGPLGGWPSVPDSTLAPPVGAALSMFGPGFQAPRTARVSFGLSGALDARTILHLAAAYRHTDLLPRREDLNLITTAVARDQHGRPIYGELVQQGGLIAARPGSNRRFEGFDLVSALNADGFSSYVGITVGLERRLGRAVHLVASYTYSRTRDNWLARGGGTPEQQLTPFPEGRQGLDWRESRSDFDLPHRVTLGAELEFGHVRVGWFYRYQSGWPFTPGFRPGVDVNGDGSSGNDPAFVDDRIAGVADLFPEWDCLREQVGRFAERNACRSPGVNVLDLRLAVVSLRVRGVPFELVIDALNLIESDVADIDRALYLVDRNGALSLDPATATVSLPLVANPGFGRPVIRRTPGRVVRLGVRVNYD